MRLLWFLALGGCNWISSARLDAELDGDADGITLEEGDCNDDDASAGIATNWYADRDGDGFGDPTTRREACSPGPDEIAEAGDCDDDEAGTHPGAIDLCNLVDDDCDEDVDEDEPSQDAFVDADGDGHGDPVSVTSVCGDLGDLVLLGDDCNDASSALSPTAIEICNGLDDDCDGLVDDDDQVDPATLLLWAPDLDGDNFVGSTEVTDLVSSCAAPPNHILATSDPALFDCDDTTISISPIALEQCSDGIDNDCDGTIDLNGVDGVAYFVDADEDGWPDSFTEVFRCNDGDALFVLATDFDASVDPIDCDPTDATIFPGAVEIYYDTIDQDCVLGNDGDADGDGAIASIMGGDDCDDSNPNMYPGNTEILYNGIDENCDGRDDDVDSDGYGIETDCNDNDASVNPAAAEIWYDGIDQNCDGNDDDQDGDGFTGNATGTGEDCDDTSAIVFPGAGEIPLDGIDQDCSGTDTVQCYADQDGDGYGSVGVFSDNGLCTGVDLADEAGDCDDTDPSIYPTAVELCDTIDQNCNGTAEGDRISGFRADGTGVSLHPGLFQSSGAVAVDDFTSIAFCGAGPWRMPALTTSQNLEVFAEVGFPRPTLEVGAGERLITSTARLELRDVDVRGSGRTEADPIAISFAGGEVIDVDLIALSGIHAVRVTGPSSWTRIGLETGEFGVSGLDFADENHAVERMVASRNFGDVGTVGPGATLTLDGSTLDGNAGGFDVYGQAVVSGTFVDNTDTVFEILDNGHLSATNSTFERNDAIRGAALRVFGSATLFDVRLYDNTAMEGGAIYVEDAAILSVEQGSIERNSSEEDGGFLFSEGLVSISDVQAAGNIAGGNGGFVANGGYLEFNEVTLTGGLAEYGGFVHSEAIANFHAESSAFTLGEATYGGAVSGPIDGFSLVFERNKARDGGALFAEAIEISLSEFSTNEAERDGGAIFGSFTFLNSSIFSDNTALGNGGALAGHGEVQGCTLYGNSALGSGGAWSLVGNTGDTGFARGSLFEANSAADFGGAIYVQRPLSAFDSSAIGNNAESGGAIFYNADSSWTGSLTGFATFEGNRAAAAGGAVYLFEADAQHTATYVDNRAMRGGATFLFDGTLDDSGSTYSRNTADATGGAIHLTAGALHTSLDLRLADNEAPSGKGVFVDSDGPTSLEATIPISMQVVTHRVDFAPPDNGLDVVCANDTCSCGGNTCPTP